MRRISKKPFLTHPCTQFGAACISVSTQHIILLACVENNKTMTVDLRYKQICGENDSFFVVVQSWVLTVAVFGSATLLAGPDAEDLFPHQ